MASNVLTSSFHSSDRRSEHQLQHLPSLLLQA
jgi:hypothetical protein